MQGSLKGKAASVEKTVSVAPVVEAAEALRDLEPDVFRGPGRKLGL